MRILVIRGKGILSLKSRASIQIIRRDRVIERHLRDLEAVLIIGRNVKIESSVPPVLSENGIPLSILSEDNVAIMYNPIVTRYNNYRKLQYTIDKTEALSIAKEYIDSKIRGMLSILSYYKADYPVLPEKPSEINNENEYEKEIRLYEAISSNIIWDRLVSLINEKYLRELREKYDFNGRVPKHPDPFNKTLSVMYAVLYSLATRAIISAGLDPTYGFLHRTRYSTPLTFDYTEMFKPVAIQATIELINSNGLPEIKDDGELSKKSINKAINTLYNYLTLKHRYTRKTLYQYIYIKAFCLAKYLENKCNKQKLIIIWNRKHYKK